LALGLIYELFGLDMSVNQLTPLLPHTTTVGAYVVVVVFLFVKRK